MKILTLLFLTLNVIFFMWQYHNGSLLPAVNESLKVRSDLAPIMLVEETKRNAVNADNAEPTGSYSVKKFRVISDFQPSENPVEQKPPIENMHKQPISVSQIEADTIHTPGLQSEQTLSAQSFVEQDQPKNQPDPNTKKASGADGQGKSLETEAVCYEVGPFANQNQYNSWKNKFKKEYVEIKLINREDPKNTGYFVYYPAEATFEKSEANVNRLKEKGIQDYWLMTDGETKGEISLGFLRTLERAEVLKKELLEKGITVFIRPISKEFSALYAWIKTLEKKRLLSTTHENWQLDNPELTVKVTDSCRMP